MSSGVVTCPSVWVVVAVRGHGSLGEVAAVGVCLLVVLPDQDRARESKECFRTGEDADDTGAALEAPFSTDTPMSIRGSR
jgi:hypothetical protein